MSTARTGAPQALMAAITAAATPATGALSPVPKSASTTAAARASRRARASTSAGAAGAPTPPPAPRHAASTRAAAPPPSSGRTPSPTSTGTRARPRVRATTKPAGPRGAERRVRDGRRPQRGELARALRIAARIGVVARVQLDGVRAGLPAGCDRGRLRVDEQAHADAGGGEAPRRRRDARRVRHYVQSPLGGELLPALGHQAGVVRPPAQREVDHRVGDGHLEVQLDAQGAPPPLHG